MSSRPESWRRALRTEATIVRVRWAGVAFGLFQALTYYRPYPSGILPTALTLLAVLTVGNGLLELWRRRLDTPEAARRYALAACVFDLTTVMAFVYLYTFDRDTASFALVYVLPLAGAVRFQLAGALGAMTAATALYALRELYGAVVFGYELVLTSITFRMGIGYIIAAVAGTMAGSLVRERDELEAATVRLEEQATFLRQQARALKSTNAELQAANQVKDDFLAMTNHELRTPLTTILGYAALLAKRWDDIPDSDKHSYLTRIGEQGNRLLALVEDLLSLSTGTARRVQLEPVAVRQAVEEALRGLADDVRVCVDVDPLLQVVADRRRLVQALTNYLSNARKYGATPITVDARPVGDDVHICVTDSGSGVPQAFAPQLFDKFTQASRGTTRTAEGTGLGLAIVRELTESQGGRCWYEAGEPTGSRFLMSLRRAGPDTSAEGPSRQERRAPIEP